MRLRMSLVIATALLLGIIAGGTGGWAQPASRRPVGPSGSELAAWTMLQLPDTGQIRDYTPTFGEDSDYTIHPPAYAATGDGTVVDQVTSLVWQQTDGGEMTWASAVSYCQGLDLAGRSDWRLPDSHELFGILNHDQVNPALDTTYFPATQAQYWWAAGEQAGNANKAWAVNAGGGIGAHPKSETVSAGGSKRFHARCVRGGGSVTAALLNNGDGTVTDGRTGLTWQQASQSARAWEAALPGCETLVLGGHDDWRLPNIKELRSINDDSRSRPSVDTTYFPDTAPGLYWSSTSNMNVAAGEAWSVRFDTGLVSHDAKTGSEAVRCVRGGVSTPSGPGSTATAPGTPRPTPTAANTATAPSPSATPTPTSWRVYLPFARTGRAEADLADGR